jgi:hypothetical protein
MLQHTVASMTITDATPPQHIPAARMAREAAECTAINNPAYAAHSRLTIQCKCVIGSCILYGHSVSLVNARELWIINIHSIQCGGNAATHANPKTITNFKYHTGSN